ncbi:hypothetical protein F1847_06200 [Thermodesulfobacterium sp. TA1]|uniref:ComEC/Rec2 family competence protein n=1 Tax=Thermodesulfobacterium sp. TA1 TaxID=2234087 RepID=UPI001232885B|nr:ComEC/Rec2 family competence protein [Thermodesulfobacterium sp. TA1]QER42354.1 hypothetical protein F1847_06200 [Thermodesulfobacterium sp. TA1]
MVRENVNCKRIFFPERNSILFILISGFILGLFLGFLGIPWFVALAGIIFYLIFTYIIYQERNCLKVVVFGVVFFLSLIFSQTFWEPRFDKSLQTKELESYVVIEKVEPYFEGYLVEAYHSEKGKIIFKTDGLVFVPGDECLLWLKPKVLKEYLLPFSLEKGLRLKTKGYEEELSLVKEKGWVCRSSESFSWERFRFKLFEFSERLNPTAKGLFQALVLGVETNLPEEFKERLKDQGLYHLLAISGFNLAVMFGLVYNLSFWLLRLTPVFRWEYPLQNLACFTALPAAFVIVVFSGFCPSAYRAFVFLVIYVLSRLFFRGTSGLMVLFLTAGLILLFQPYLIGNLSFQLSFLATLGLILGDRFYKFYLFSYITASSYENRWYYKILIWIVYSSFISGVVSVLLMPFIFSISGKFPVGTVLNNLLAGGFWSLVFIPGCILTAFISFVFPEIAVNLGNLIGKIFDLYTYLPFWEGFFTLSLPLNLFCCLWFIFIILGVIVWKLNSKKVFFSCLIFFFSTLGLVYFLFKNINYFVVLDVGRANAMIFKAKDKYLMVDTGPNFTVNGSFNWTKFYLEPTLRKLGVSLIEILIVSHPDLDHSGGFNTLKKDFLIKKAITGRFTQEDWQKVNLIYPLEEISVPQGFKIGDTEVYLFPGEESYEDLNRESLVVVVEHKGFTVFCPGDIDVERFYRLKEEGELFPVEVLVSPHHGSKKGINQEILTWLKPKVVLTSGRGPYHPHPEFKSLLEKQEIPHFSTSEEGTLYVFPKDDYFIICLEKTRRKDFGLRLFFPLVPYYVVTQSCKTFDYHKSWEIINP